MHRLDRPTQQVPRLRVRGEGRDGRGVEEELVFRTNSKPTKGRVGRIRQCLPESLEREVELFGNGPGAGDVAGLNGGGVAAGRDAVVDDDEGLLRQRIRLDAAADATCLSATERDPGPFAWAKTHISTAVVVPNDAL